MIQLFTSEVETLAARRGIILGTNNMLEINDCFGCCNIEASNPTARYRLDMNRKYLKVVVLRNLST